MSVFAFPHLIAPLARFARSERASLSIEAAIMLPILTVMFVMGYQYFDQFRREAQMTKASFAVADALSRFPGAVTIDQLNALEQVYEYLTYSEGNSYMRFTEVRRDGDEMKILISYATDGQAAMTDVTLTSFLSQIPRLDDNQRITLVEAYTYDNPFFLVGLQDRIIPNFVPMNHRYDAGNAFWVDEDFVNDEGNTTVQIDECEISETVNGLVLIGAGSSDSPDCQD